MYYLFACNRDLLKVIVAMFHFCHSNNPLNTMNSIFNSISIYFFEKNSLLTNIRNKCVARKINLNFSDIMKKWSNVSFKSLPFSM